MKVVWTRRSIYRLEKILEYIAKDQPGNAMRFVERLIERSKSVAQQPRRGQIDSHRTPTFTN